MNDLLVFAKRLLADPVAGVPAKVRARAFPYQFDGMRWLTRPLADVGDDLTGMILGDEQGLGKTLQAAAAANAIAAPGESILVVVPATIKMKWGNVEIPLAVDEPHPDVCIVGKEPLRKARWIVLNYDILLRNYIALRDMGFAVLICDEAHYLKNRDSDRTKAIIGGTIAWKKLKGHPGARTKNIRLKGLAALASRVYMLSGTVITNHTRDIFPLLRAVGSPLGRSFSVFGKEFCGAKQTGFGTVYNGSSNIQILRKQIAPYYLRRNKAQELDLPPKLRDWVPVEVDLKLYNKALQAFQERRRQKAEENRRAGKKAARDCTIVDLLQARMALAASKITASIELAESAINSGQKVIIFSSFSEPLRHMQEHFGNAAVLLDGSVKEQARFDAVKRFQEDPECKVFLGNLIAAGVGIDLTEASTVIFNDLDWIPLNHMQAEDRAWRIGTKLMVNVIYVLAADSIDEDMAPSLERKFKNISEFQGDSDDELFQELLERMDRGPRNADVAKLSVKARKKKAA